MSFALDRPAPVSDLGSNLQASEPGFFAGRELAPGQMVLNMGPQHPSTHGVLRLEVLTEGEQVIDVVPHIGYLHRCFERHAEHLPYNQIIPFVDRLDYVAAMNSEHVYVMAVEKMLGLEGKLDPRTEYIRVLVCELNRIASHFVAIGTYGLDIGAFTPFLWLMRDREHIQRMLEWVCGARMLYNYIWIGGLFYDLPVGFEKVCADFIRYLPSRLDEARQVLVENRIFIARTAGVGVLAPDRALAYAVSGPMLRGSGFAIDSRRTQGYSVYPELEFDVPVGQGMRGVQGDCWDRTWVRMQECYESVRIIRQCLEKLTGVHARTPGYDPQAFVPKKIRPEAQQIYFSAETPRGDLGFHISADGRSDMPIRCHARSGCFVNLAALPEISRGGLLADLVAVIGSIDVVMGEVDR